MDISPPERGEDELKFSRWLDSPVLLAILVGTTVALAFAWQKSESKDIAPNIPGYSWSEHPDVALISYQSSCCGISQDDWVTTALKHKGDVLVLSSKPHPEVQRLAQVAKHSRFQTIVIDNEEIHKFWSPNNFMGAARIVNGRVLARSEGGIPPSFLFQPLE